MKKQTAMALAAVFAMSVAGTALAAPANPFVDVPAKHWAYDSLNKLAQAGVVSGYGDGTYKGDKTLTRYEVATIVAKAMANSEKADAAAQKEIEALKAEFGTELNNLGVRVDNLESRIDNVKFSGIIRARYDSNEVNKVSAMTQKLRTRLMVQGKINDTWTYNGRLENVNDMRVNNVDDDDTKTPGETEIDLNWAYVQGKVGVFDVTAGRFNAKPAYGVVLDDSVEGINVGFGNKLKVNLFAGKENYSELFDAALVNDRNNTYIASLAYSFNKKLNAKAAYFDVDYQLAGQESAKVYEVGADYQFNKTLNLRTVYAKNTMSDLEDDNAFVAQLSYKGATPANPGSFGMWAAYRNQDASTILSSTYDVDQVAPKVAGVTNYLGGKGYEVGVTYAPMKNAVWTTTYTDLKSTETGTDVDGKYFRTQVEFYF